MLAKLNISEDYYLRQRSDPHQGDPLYLHLSDLLLALRQVAAPHALHRVLDFGCGGSPYRSLFQVACYHRADFAGTPNLDFEFGEDSAISAPDQSYDVVLSTQVFEHVRHPARYLDECNRLLTAGGRLVLSTHGTFADHGCPYDFHRWTADGLRLAVEMHGFRVTSVRKITSGARALAFLARTFAGELSSKEKSPMALGMRLLQRTLIRYPAAVDAFCDRVFPASARVSEAKAGETVRALYIALLIEAEKI